ncbi:MAG: hypothetical protein K6G47_02320 [Clostridia bacterium]|nr:hypothetical protein [Clostridia bacterium]
MDNTIKFDGYADDYTSGRPDYAKELIDSFYSSYGFDKYAKDGVVTMANRSVAYIGTV